MSDKTQNKAKLIEGPVGPLLFRLTVPMIWGILAIMAFNVIDTIFIAKLGTTHLAAISFTFPVVMVVTNLAIGLGIGASSVVSRAIGEDNHQEIQNLTISALILSFVLAVVFIVIGYLTTEPLFSLLGAGDDTLPLISAYMNVWYLGIGFLIIPIVGNYIVRATGDMFWPAMVMAGSSILNLILDPILIFGWFGFPRMEMAGAALATVISWVMSFGAVFIILYFREKFICLRCPKMSTIGDAIKSIVSVALPAASTHMIIPIGAGVIMSMIASFGEEAVAAFGAASRIEMLALIVFLAMSAIMGPFVGQNVGANKCERIKEALRICYSFCFWLGLIQAVLLAVFAKPLVTLFDTNPVVLGYGVKFLQIMPIAYIAHGIIYIASGVFNGSGHPIPAVVVSVVRMFVLYIPLAYVLKKVFGVSGIFAAYTITTFIMGIVAYLWSFKLINIKQA